jgi:hypothetical protein
VKAARTIATLGGLFIIGLTAFALVFAGKRQRLGEPGVKVGNVSIFDEHGKVCATNSVLLPESAGGFLSKPSPITDKELAWLPKDTTFGRRIYYSQDGYAVEASTILMGTDRSSIHKPEYCLVGQGWSIYKEETIEIPLETEHPTTVEARKFSVRIKGKTAEGKTVEMNGFYVFWFVADGMRTASHWKRMEWHVRDLLLRGVLDRWAYISYFRPCVPGTEEAEFARMKTVIAKTAPLFMNQNQLGGQAPQKMARNE